MNLNELIQDEMESAFHASAGLVELVEDVDLNWKPATGSNWMTTGQLLLHLGHSCGACFKGFATGDWGMPDGQDISKMSPEEMLPPAEKLPTVKSVADAKRLLNEDRETARRILAACSNEQLTTELKIAPWHPVEQPLGQRFMQMIEHLNSHKGQLFYYLKLQGKPVNTAHLWGMLG